MFFMKYFFSLILLTAALLLSANDDSGKSAERSERWRGKGGRSMRRGGGFMEQIKKKYPKEFAEIEKLQESDDSVFILTIGTTETSKIPNLSGAGATPELTEYTPAADAEFMVLGDVRCTDAAAETVVGDAAAPTPARLTKAALQLANIPFVIVDAGSKVKPDVEYVSLGKDYGRDIRTGKGILNPLEIFENA